MFAALLVCVAGPLSIWGWWTFSEAQFYKDALPEVIQTTGILTAGSDASIVEFFLPIRREGCGGVVFGLTSETTEAVETQGLSFLESARQGRAYPVGSKKAYYYSYEHWQKTPVPPGWLGDGILALGFHCMDLRSSESQAIDEAARKPGSYFTTKPEGILLVIPTLGLAVFTYYG